MVEITSIPSTVEGFDCNVCRRAINHLSSQKTKKATRMKKVGKDTKEFVLRCEQCDVDVCWRCVEKNAPPEQHDSGVKHKEQSSSTKEREDLPPIGNRRNNELKTPRSLPADVVGVIADFACETLRGAPLLMVVSSTWQQGVDAEESMWLRFTRAIWPEAKEGGGRRKSVLKSRLKVARQYPLNGVPMDTLHPIENCANIGAEESPRCPTFAENHLVPLSSEEAVAQGFATDSPVFRCKNCKRCVASYNPVEKMHRSVEDGGRCVRTNDGNDFVYSCKQPEVVVGITSADNDYTLWFMLKLRYHVNGWSTHWLPCSIGGSDFLWRPSYRRRSVDIRFVHVPVEPSTNSSSSETIVAPSSLENTPAKNAVLLFVLDIPPSRSSSPRMSLALPTLPLHNKCKVYRGIKNVQKVVEEVNKKYPYPRARTKH